MNIYLLRQDINRDWETYDSAIVSAENEDEARNIHPQLIVDKFTKDVWENSEYYGWVRRDQIHLIKVKLIGKSFVEKGLVLASFRAWQ